MGPDVEHYHSYNCQCAVCRSRLPKPATEEDLKFYEQQAERIKELEAERDAERDNCVAVIATYQAELAALRQRIDDAPVVAWMGEYNINDIRDHYTVVMRNKTDFDKLPERLRPLYTTPQPAIPTGYALVRLFELENALESYDGGDGQSCHRILRNIIAAAPKPENSHD